MKPGKQKIYAQSTAICACRSPKDLEQLLHIPRNQLSLLAVEPLYYRFRLPKSDGTYRDIEAPAHQLKRVQRKLNDYLQAVYYMMKPAISYGYIRAVRREQDMRNIVTNAQKHLGAKCLMNVDFEDFFHQVQTREVADILAHKPFQFDKATAHLLARLCTIDGRLPMGAPTSPVLSNMACIALDKVLLAWGHTRNFTITRFVDDISISSKDKEIHLGHFFQLATEFKRFGFHINPKKTKYYNETDLKMVTGLVLGERVDVPKEFYKALDADLQRLKSVVEVDLMTGRLPDAGMIKRFKQEVMGKVNFLSVVSGKNNAAYQQYLDHFEEAIAPPAEVLSARWITFNYIS